MSYNIFLDDERLPADVRWVKLPNVDWVILRSYAQFVEQINNNGLPLFISFDHDLGDEHYKDYHRARETGQPLDYDSYNEKTGYDCAKWLVGYCMDKGLDFPDYNVHSMNIIGKDNIVGLINSYRRSRSKIIT